MAMKSNPMIKLSAMLMASVMFFASANTAYAASEQVITETSADPNHVHKFSWVAFMNESESADGTLRYMCEGCGKVWYFREIDAYHAYQGATAHKILTAEEGETVKVKTSLFINWNTEVMEALAERPDVSLYVSFLDDEYKGNRVSVTIPAGEDTMSLLDENGYCGYLYLGGIYGLTMEVPQETPDSYNTDDANESENQDADVQEGVNQDDQGKEDTD